MLKPQDILIALAIIIQKGEQWRQTDIAAELGISPSEVNAGIKRLIHSKLMEPGFHGKKPSVVVSALKEFLIHGCKYVFPAEIGGKARGIPTSYAAPIFKNEISHKEDDKPVWPDAKGHVQGYALMPLYPSVNQIQNEVLYSLLALVDAIRSGRARERNIGIKLLEEKLNEYAA